MSAAGSAEGRLDWLLLKRVSRSFFLTIRCLPGEVRETIALGYLLARASDSIADTSAAPMDRRVEALQELREGEIGQRMLVEMVRHQAVGAEAELLTRLPDLLEALEESRDRERLRWVWEKILRGQMFDLMRFVDSDDPLTAEELDEYTYLVAGSVGEFWTELCYERIERFAARDRAEQVALGVRYGKGLQLVNILRDRDEDAAAGRTYVTAEDAPAAVERARAGMQAGLDWAGAVNAARLRYACVLPARIGLATLDLLGAGSLPVKIPRAQVRRILLKALPIVFQRAGVGGAR